ncbi:hypothetical protein B0H19DRAFT_1076948 [Mycena capillaripes]|nr:hypothetical protein B0H19DRAFT_1076948 [Mycena capillaripes]
MRTTLCVTQSGLGALRDAEDAKGLNTKSGASVRIKSVRRPTPHFLEVNGRVERAWKGGGGRKKENGGCEKSPDLFAGCHRNHREPLAQPPPTSAAIQHVNLAAALGLPSTNGVLYNELSAKGCSSVISTWAFTIISKMGRRAIHLTRDAKAAAKREQVKKYSQTPHGQAARASPSTEIQDLYDAPLLVHEPLFQEALRPPDALDKSDLSRWKKEPPFVEDEDSTDPYSDDYLAFTNSLVSVLHGVCLREQTTRDAQWRAEFLEKGWKTSMVELREEVCDLLGRWEMVLRLRREHFYHPYHDSREHAMLEHYLQWLARTIYSLYYLKFLELK